MTRNVADGATTDLENAFDTNGQQIQNQDGDGMVAIVTPRPYTPDRNVN